MKHVLLDVNVVVDVCVGRPGSAVSVAAVARAKASGLSVWLYTGAVQTMEFVLAGELLRIHATKGMTLTKGSAIERARELLALFSEDLQWLAALAGEGNVYRSDDPEDEQLLQAMERFGDGEIVLLTSDKRFIRKRNGLVLTPEAFLETPLPAPSMDFIDLKNQQDLVRPQLEQNLHRVLHHGQYIMGPEIRELEARLAEFTGLSHAITCASGTDALLIALMAYGIGPGDAIFTTPFTFIATAEVISLLGATPVFVDIDPQTFNIDPTKLDLAIRALKGNVPSLHPLPVLSSSLAARYPSLRPKGIIAVDLFGLPADYDRINAVAKEHGLFVIEDAAQSFGAKYHGSKACSLANVGCTSFFPAKPLGGYGDGGAIFTDDGELAQVIRSIRVHGKRSDKYDNVCIGVNGRLDTLQAAIVLAKLDVFPREVELRQEAAARYTEMLSQKSAPLLGRPVSVVCPHVPTGYASAWAQYSLLTRNGAHRSMLQQHLKQVGIPTAIYYPKPLHLQGAFASLGYKEKDLPVSEASSSRIFSYQCTRSSNRRNKNKFARPFAKRWSTQKNSRRSFCAEL